MSEAMRTVVDRQCGKPAFRLTQDEMPAAHTLLRAEQFQHLDGTPFVTCERCDCDSCGATMMDADNWMIDEA